MYTYRHVYHALLSQSLASTLQAIMLFKVPPLFAFSLLSREPHFAVATQFVQCFKVMVLLLFSGVQCFVSANSMNVRMIEVSDCV